MRIDNRAPTRHYAIEGVLTRRVGVENESGRVLSRMELNGGTAWRMGLGPEGGNEATETGVARGETAGNGAKTTGEVVLRVV